MKSWLGALLVWLALLGFARGVARAEGHAPYQLALRAPDGAACTDGAALTQRIDERAGPLDSAAAPVRVDVEITAEREGHRALITAREQSGEVLGEREIFEPGPCAQLDDTLTLVIVSSLATLGDEAIAQPPEPPEPAQPEPASQEEAAESPAPVRFVSRDPGAVSEPSRWRLSLDVSGRGLTGLLPRAAAGATLALFAEHGDLALSGAATWLVPMLMRAGSELELDVTGVWGELHACGRAADAPPIALWFCAGLHAGALHAEAAQLQSQEPRWDALLQLAPSVQLRVALLREVGFTLGSGAAIPVLFPHYGYVDALGERAAYHDVQLGLWVQLGFWVLLSS